MVTGKTCDNCSNFSLAESIEPFGNDGQVMFFCPVTSGYWITGTEVACEKFIPATNDSSQNG